MAHLPGASFAAAGFGDPMSSRPHTMVADTLRWRLCQELEAVIAAHADSPFVAMPDHLCRTIGAAGGLLAGVGFHPKV